MQINLMFIYLWREQNLQDKESKAMLELIDSQFSASCRIVLKTSQIYLVDYCRFYCKRIILERREIF